MRVVHVLLIVLAVPAGCLAPTANDAAGDAVLASDAEGWAARAVPFGADHDHADRAAHEGLSTPNFRLLGHDPLVVDALGAPAGGYLCADANGDASRRVAVVHSLGETPVAFVVADITDPSAPRKVGELLLEGTTARDVAVSADARWVVVATELVDDTDYRPTTRGSADAAHAPAARWRDACGATRVLPTPASVPLPSPAPYASGMILVSLEDPAAPEVVDYFPLPALGAHSIGIDRVDDVDIVTASVTNVAQHGSYFMFFTVEDGKLAFQSVYQQVPVEPNAAAANLHNDGWVRKHPVTGQTIGYLADWDNGLALVDLTDLKSPRTLGRWSDYDATGGLDNSAAVHSAVPLDTTWEGRHYTFIGQEILGHPVDTPTGVISILDTTDPAAIVRVGAWTLPVDVEWDASLVFSTHYLAHVGRTLFVSMYHGGVWAVDLTDVDAPRSVGVFVPAVEPPAPPASSSFTWAPTVMEVRALDTGELAVWDSTSGLYLVAFDAARPSPAVEEWAFSWDP